ncbi:uncharacterized protein SOCE26_089210 [Sorangium cellulosum]|uniref:Uncharacterized protein n=1 Tax=Sorangium cellulosum TaxID=56 RepID=A0A2L0F7C0_SORCE|nr:hypothetical protein [Sorangium cellulosum]AUX47401.1 uncharacterized protein SOCE26_089210 [Sorangium cellulosum]
MSKATDKAVTEVADVVHAVAGSHTGNAGAGHVEGEHPEGEHAEPDRPNNARLFAIVVATLISLVVTVAFVNEVFKATMEREISIKVLEPPSSGLRGLRAMEQERLSRYQWASEKDGVVRIPVDQAIPLTLKDYQEKRIGLPVPGAANPAKPEDSATKPDEASTPNAESGEPLKGDGAAKPADAANKPADAADAAKPADAKPADATKPADAKPADATKPADAKPAKPEGAKPQTGTPVKPEGAAPKPASPAPAAPVQ